MMVAAVTIATGLEASCLVDGFGPVTGAGTAYPGERVHKSGFGTGLTAGVVTSTDATLRIDPGEALCGLMFSDADYFSVGTIGAEQLLDYARRRGMEAETVKKIIPNNV